MSQSLELKEKIVLDFIHTVSEIDSKPCEEIENNLEKIIHKTRGLIHKDLMSDKEQPEVTPPHYLTSVFVGSDVERIEQNEKRECEPWCEIRGLSWLFLGDDT